ncbi:MAG TPA: hypothetical protein VHF25_03305 [Nitriliruptorales bacterium]|nr:hypothetical protein [Nitriliruptorales bacterium]
MEGRRLLAVVSGAHLACGLAGMVIALKRRRPYDLGWIRGRPDDIARDAVFLGTALSPPVSLLVAQAVMTTAVARGQSPRAARGLGVLGATMVVGYLVERHVWLRLTVPGRDAVESPLVVAGIGLAGTMAALGLRGVGDGADGVVG